MSRILRSSAVAASFVVAAVVLLLQLPSHNQYSDGGSQQKTPPWAFPVGPAAPAPKDDGSQKHVPGSDVGLTLTQTRDAFNVPDWHPGDHPEMPEVVRHGRKPDVRGCGYCHLPNGQGRPENAS